MKKWGKKAPKIEYRQREKERRGSWRRQRASPVLVELPIALYGIKSVGYVSLQRY